MLEITQLKSGTIFKYHGEPALVLSYKHTHMGRGSATVRIKMRSLVTGKVLELSFKGNDKVEEADIERSSANFLYKDQSFAYFMNNKTFDQFELPTHALEDSLLYLKEGMELAAVIFEGKPMGIEIPKKVQLRIAHTEPAVRGDTAQGSATNPAETETGLTLNVPLFVSEGQEIIINTDTGEYVERA